MTYLHYLIACQERDVEAIKKMLTHDIRLNIVSKEGVEFQGDYNQIIDLLDGFFREECLWDFDVLHRAERPNEELILIKATREDSATGNIGTYLWLLTLDKEKKEQYLKKMHVEVVCPIKDSW